MNYQASKATQLSLLAAMFGISIVTVANAQGNSQKSQMFQGAKANTGYVLHAKENGVHVLTLSDDFVIPDTPAPHWQVVDSKGNVYLLNRLRIKDDKVNKSIKLPAYIQDVAKVQIWCAWAETLLGEAKFEKVQM